jgi:uncharacterized protein (TIGR01777 family)
MQIFISGGTGFIGSALCQNFATKGHTITVLSRNSAPLPFSNVQVTTDVSVLSKERFDLVINLAGEPLDGQRWTPLFKEKLCSSRTQTTKRIVDAILQNRQKPKVFLSGSAVGFYGNNDKISFTEHLAPLADDFPHKLCAQWEAATCPLQDHSIRICTLRTGIVLGRHERTNTLGGALKQLVTPFRLGLGAQLGNGRQWMSWIHREDWVGIINFILNTPDLSGPINLTAPYPVTNAEFSRTLAKTLHRPFFFTIPAPIVRTMFGEMGKDLLLHGQKVLPEKVLSLGYRFLFPELSLALKDILQKTG